MALALDAAAVVVALAYLLLAWAGTALLGPVLHAIASSIPYVGNRVDAWASARLQDVASAVASWAETGTAAITGLLSAPALKAAHLWARTAASIAAVAGFAAALPDRLLAAARDWATEYVAGQVSDLRGFVADSLHALAGTLLAAVRSAADAASAALASAVQGVRAEFGQAVAGASATAATEAAAASALASQALAAAEAAQQRAEAATALAQQLAGQLGGLTPAQVAGEVAAGVAGAEGFAQGLAQGLSGDIAKAAAAASAAGALGVAVKSALDTYLRECGDPLCQGLSRMAQAESELQGLFQDGSLVGLLAGAVADPAGTAAAVRADLEQPAADAVAAVRALLGR